MSGSFRELTHFLGMRMMIKHQKPGRKKKEQIRNRKEYLEAWRLKMRPPVDWD